MRVALSAALTFTALVAASPAYSCTVVVPQGYEGSAHQRRDVREAIERAPLIVDGEVVRAWTTDLPALVMVEHTLKGSAGEFVEVGETDSCSIRLDRVGERMRMILSGGPETYALSRDQSEARLEDRILHSDRRRVWPYVHGAATVH